MCKNRHSDPRIYDNSGKVVGFILSTPPAERGPPMRSEWSFTISSNGIEDNRSYGLPY